jgi:hypothetical protein
MPASPFSIFTAALMMCEGTSAPCSILSNGGVWDTDSLLDVLGNGLASRNKLKDMNLSLKCVNLILSERDRGFKVWVKDCV